MTGFRLAVDVMIGVAWLRAFVILADRPASRWRTRWLGKVVSLLATALMMSVWFGVVVPWGGALVWWRVIARTRDPFELPMADGRRMP